MWLRLTATEPGTCRIAAEPAAVSSGLCTPAIGVRSPALAEGDSIAYFALNPLGGDGDERRWELGTISHGPGGPELAARLCEQIRAWDQARGTRPVITIHPAGSPDTALPSSAYAIPKFSTRLALTL